MYDCLEVQKKKEKKGAFLACFVSITIRQVSEIYMRGCVGFVSPLVARYKNSYVGLYSATKWLLFFSYAHFLLAMEAVFHLNDMKDV